MNIIKLLLHNSKDNINLRTTSKIKELGDCFVFESKSESLEKSSLYYAVKYNNIELIQLLIIQPNIDINFGIKEVLLNHEDYELLQEKTPLYLSVENYINNLEIVKLLLTNPNTNVSFESTFVDSKNKIQKKTAKQLAVERGNTGIIRLFELNETKKSSSQKQTEDDFLKQLSFQVLNDF